MAKKSDIFDGLMESLGQAKQIAAGKKLPGARIQKYVIKPARDFRPQDIKRIRKSIEFTQEMLAKFLQVSLATVRSWEQGLSTPLGPSRRLLEGLDKCSAELISAYAKINVVRVSKKAS